MSGRTITIESPETDRRSAARRGAVAMLPLIVGYAPFALVVGAAAAEHGAPLAGWAGSWLIYGGSAHLAALRTLDRAGPVMAILTGLLINARLLVYSSSLARRWPAQPRWFRVIGAGLIIDPTWAAAERHAGECDDLRQQRHYFIAAGLTLGAGWSTAIGAGALLGARLDWLDLRVVVPLCLLGLVGPELRARDSRSVVIVAGAIAVLTADWPAGTGLVAAIAGGCAAGMVGGRWSRS
ncbi:MAG: AzlC family ABC transporter permease [Acidimicrobiia bacterium]